MLVYLPIEAYEERYTAQLDRWMKIEFDKNNIDYITVYGDILSNTIDEGQVLDGTGRPYYCLTQMSKVMKLMKENKIKSGDKIFTTDIWLHGLEAIPYAATIQKKNIDIYACNLAGTFENYDFLNLTGMTSWGQYLEKSWFAFCKKVFFGSETLRMMAIRNRMMTVGKSTVTGLAFNSEDVYNTIGIHPKEKKDIVIFPHRWDVEKRPEIFLKVAKKVHNINPNIKFVITTGRKDLRGTASIDEAIRLQKQGIVDIKFALSKSKYYELLADAKIVFSSALQDTIGNAMMEAITHGCTPVATDEVSYHEYLPQNFLWYNIDEAIEMIFKYIEKPINCRQYIKKYDNSIHNMLNEMELV